MEISTTRDHADADQVIAFQHTDCLSPIFQLPTELFVGIFQLALPEIPFLSDYTYYYSHSYVKKLYIMRSVTKRWQGIIEGTPSFWTTIDSTISSYINEASIFRSSGLPLSIIYRQSERSNELESWPSATEFLKLIAHTRPRWSTVALDLYNPTTFSDYLGAPLPLLQTIVVRGLINENRYPEPLELLGGDTINLRFVALSGVSIRWRLGCFVQLKYLKLTHMDRSISTGSHLLDVLGASGGLRVLKLKGINISIPPPSPIITLHHLKYIKLRSCAIELVEWVLHQIHAPSCTKLVLNTDEEQVFDIPRFLDETLKPFHGLLRMMHKRLGESEILLHSGGIQWDASDYTNQEQGFSIFIEGFFDALVIRWVDRILQDESGLQIVFEDRATSNEAVLRSLAPMRQVTKAVIRASRRGVDIPRALRFLSKPLSTTTSLPSLPCLREIKIPSGGWDTQDVLDMVESRFRALSSEGMEETLLTINVDRPGFNWVISSGSILDLATLVKMRETIGVKCVRLDGWKDPKGMLAVAWNEEGSEPVWV